MGCIVNREVGAGLRDRVSCAVLCIERSALASETASRALCCSYKGRQWAPRSRLGRFIVHIEVGGGRSDRALLRLQYEEDQTKNPTPAKQMLIKLC